MNSKATATATTDWQIHKLILKEFGEDAYYIGQVGWCGPRREEAEKREQELRAATAQFQYASSETAYGRTVGYDFAIKVF